MKKDLIQKEYKKKIKLLAYHKQKYYNDNTPEISDSEFDELKKDTLDLERKYKFLKSTNSPSISVGHKPSKNFRKVLHKVPMLSLMNAFSEEDLFNFEKKILNFLSQNNNSNFSYTA